MAKKKNSRELDELQVSLLDDKNFLKGIIETFCQRLLGEEIEIPVYDTTTRMVD